MRRNGFDSRGVGTAHARRSALIILGLAPFAVVGCVYAPYAPRDLSSLGPPGESEPVVDASHNPLDANRVVDVVCSPQGQPIIETPESRDCEADEDCKLVCGDGIGER